MNRHKKVHTNEKPFSCAHCEYKCTEKYNLDKHIKTQHGQSKEEVPLDPSQTNLEATKSKEGEEEKEADEVEENEELDLEQPGPSQENMMPYKQENGRWKCPCCSFDSKWISYIKRHINHRHSGTLDTLFSSNHNIHKSSCGFRPFN